MLVRRSAREVATELLGRGTHYVVHSSVLAELDGATRLCQLGGARGVLGDIVTPVAYSADDQHMLVRRFVRLRLHLRAGLPPTEMADETS